MRPWIAAVVAAMLLAIAPAHAQQTPQPQAPAQAPASAPAPEDAKPAPAPTNEAKPAPPTEVPPEIAQQIGRISGSIEAAEKTLERIRNSDADLARVRGEIDELLAETAKVAEHVRPLLSAARRQVESLGPQPAKDAPPEAPAIATERARLGAVTSGLDGALKSIDLSNVRGRELIQRITELRQSLFTRNLMRRTHSPLMPHHWQRAANDLPAAAGFAEYLVTDWIRAVTPVLPQLFAFVFAALVSFVGLTLCVRWLIRQSNSPPPGGRSFFQRAQRIAWIAPARMLPTVIAVGILQFGLYVLDLLSVPGTQIITAILEAILLSVVVATVIITVLSPRTPGLRLVNLANRPARHIGRYLTGIVAVYAVDMALADIGRTLVAPLSLTVVRTFGASLIYAALLTGLLLTRFAKPPTRSPETGALIQHATPLYAPWWLKLPLWVITGLILGCTLLGYIPLGRFIAQQLVLSGTVLVAAGVCYLTIRTITRTIEEPTNPLGLTLRDRLRFAPTRVNEFAWLAELLLTTLLLMIVVPVFLIQWGFTAAEIRDWFATAFFGFEVGQFKVSPARILVGVVIFVALLFVTRIVQRWLRERVLEPRRVEAGISNSIETTIGYAGIALSALVAVSYAGLDVTNLAIVAGALSVGIGFGLQSIVNNFVSGLILLVERPVKVGDRIVAGDQEGHVRRISVRSTEIETFDQARLIIPNSELITGRVINKTHRSLVGRGTVRVGAHYSADPEKVIEILVSCAKAHPQVLTEPAPGAVFDNFGVNSLDFFMWFFVADVGRAGSVQSDLRIAIMKAFKEAGIEIPYNQHDIHLRDLDGVRTLVSRVLEERASKARGRDEPPDRTAADVDEKPGEGEPPPESPPPRGG